jgi:hypothetical protein
MLVEQRGRWSLTKRDRRHIMIGESTRRHTVVEQGGRWLLTDVLFYVITTFCHFIEEGESEKRLLLDVSVYGDRMFCKNEL